MNKLRQLWNRIKISHKIRKYNRLKKELRKVAIKRSHLIREFVKLDKDFRAVIALNVFLEGLGEKQ